MRLYIKWSGSAALLNYTHNQKMDSNRKNTTVSNLIFPQLGVQAGNFLVNTLGPRVHCGHTVTVTGKDEQGNGTATKRTGPELRRLEDKQTHTPASPRHKTKMKKTSPKSVLIVHLSLAESWRRFHTIRTGHQPRLLIL